MEQRQNRIQSFAFIIGVCISFCLSIGFVPSLLEHPSDRNDIQLDNLINPNDAPVASLVRLPGIGPAKAQAIVAYRENFGKDESQPFRSCEDLQKIKGIGPKTAESISEFLRFEEELK